MTSRIPASLVHVLTASGAALALMALLAAANSNWEEMFIWLGLALIVDGIDGPLARAAQVDQVLPRFSGVRLDLIVDYLTYVAVPAFALARAELLPEAFRLPAAIAILLSSLFHVADRRVRPRTAISSASRRFGISFAFTFSFSCHFRPCLGSLLF